MAETLDCTEESPKTWGGYRHGRKRQSTVKIADLHVAVLKRTHAALAAKAEEIGITMGQVVDQIVRNSEQP